MQPLEGIPDILYKYRDWTNEYHRELLLNRELYFSSANQFNDPFDAALPFKYNESQLTDDNIFLKHIQLLKFQQPGKTDGEYHSIAYEQQRKGLLKDYVYRESLTDITIENINKKFGIVSLTGESNNFLMWSHYSNSHSGLCIGFDKHILFQQVHSFEPVTSSDDFP